MQRQYCAVHYLIGTVSVCCSVVKRDMACSQLQDVLSGNASATNPVVDTILLHASWCAYQYQANYLYKHQELGFGASVTQ